MFAMTFSNPSVTKPLSDFQGNFTLVIIQLLCACADLAVIIGAKFAYTKKLFIGPKVF